MRLGEAKKLRSIIELSAVSLDDKTASEGAELFPQLKGDGTLIKVGTRINWLGVIKRAAVDLWESPENTPDAAPALWEDIEYKDGYRIIPEVITAGTAFAKGEYGWWGDVLYESLIDANVHTPSEYPAGWSEVSE